MKMKKRILGVLICLVLASLVALTVFATEGAEYTGTVEDAYVQLGLVDTKVKLSDKIKSIKNVSEYMDTVDPESDGYAELVKAVDLKEIEIAELQLADMAELTVSSELNTALDSIKAYLEIHPFVDERAEGERFEDAYAATVSKTAEAYLTESYAAATADEKHDLLDSLAEFLANYEVKETEVYNAAAVELENFECAKLYLAAVNTDSGVAKFGATLRQMKGFVHDHAFSTSLEGYNSFILNYNKLVSDFEKAYEAARKEANNGVYVSDLDKIPVMSLDFTPSDKVTNPNNKTGQLVAEKNMSGTTQLSFIGTEYDEATDNGYYTVKYEIAKNHFRTVANIKSITKSAVFECDFTTFSKLPNYDQPGKLIWFENGSAAVNGKSWNQVYFSINSNGDIVKGTSANAVLVEGAVTPGEWVHLSIVMDIESNEVDIYVDYELVLTYSLAHSDGYTNNFVRIQMGCNPDLAGGEFSIDNVMLYQGHAPRDIDFNKNTTEEEKFLFYANQIYNTKLPLTARKEYYDAASRLLSNYYDGENYLTQVDDVCDAVNSVLEFNSAEVLAQIMADNLEGLKAYELKLRGYTRSESTYANRAYFLAKTDSYIASTAGLIQPGDEYNQMSAFFSTIRAQLAEEDVLTEFNTHIKNFYAAASVDFMELSYNAALAMLDKVDPKLAEGDGFPTFADCYSKFRGMAVLLQDYKIVDNSKKLLACLQFIYDYDTPEEWEENYDYLISYVLMAGDIIASGIYDEYYKNSKELIEHFMPMYDYFNIRIQEKHIEYIKAELARYDALPFSRYFEKYGICLKLRDYVNSENIDYELEELAALIETFTAHIEELEASRGDYDALLKDNTAVFIEKCAGLVGSIGYADMKVLCEEARIYFYSMDVDDASAQDAIKIYTARCAEIEYVEAHAKKFIDSVLYLATPEIDLRAAIVSAAQYLDKLEGSVSGVALALEQFERVCNEYDASYASANADLDATVEVTCGMMNDDGFGGIIKMVLRALVG